MRSWLRLLTELSSRKQIARIAGWFAKSGLSRRLIPRFVRTYGISVEEAEKLPEEYESLNAFFTRRLKPGCRPIDPAPDALVSPVDGVITGMGPVESGSRVHVKGQNYQVEELLNHSPRSVSYRNGYFFVIYLSPSDYHRIHAPVTGEIVEKEHIAGRVCPVNDFAMRHIPRVLSRNERQVTYIRHDKGEIAVIKVGAMNVSSIRYVSPLPNRLRRGQEMAVFEFGSTVVLLAEKGTFLPRDHLEPGARVRMGESLGHLQ